MSKIVVAILLWGFSLTALAATILHEQRSLYSRIVVKKTGSMICLQFSVRADQRNQSCVDTRRPKAMVFSYTRMSMAALLFAQDPQRILVIGLGGGTLPSAFHALYPQAHVDAVEIDPAVVAVAKQYFKFNDAPNLQVHVQDARVWTKRAVRAGSTYDIIVLDAFNGDYIPEHLMTQEYLQETKALLAPGAILVANTFAVSDLYDHESATYASVFSSFINFRVPESANRLIMVPGKTLDDDALSQRAAALSKALSAYSVPIKRYARIIKSRRKRGPDWRVDTRILTDQYSPANLLKNR